MTTRTSPSADPLAQFEWPVADKYGLIETELGLALTPQATYANPPRRYRPFSKHTSGLFLKFANLESAIENGRLLDVIPFFVHTYGLLGAPVTWESTSGPVEILGRVSVRRAKQYHLRDDHTWFAQIALMNRFLKAAKPVPNPEDSKWTNLMPRINMMLQDTCAPVLDWNENDSVDSQFRLNWVPRSLLGALWLQAVWSVTRPTRFQECSVCGRIIELSLHKKTGGRRADARICSDKCRTQAYRSRKKRAQQLVQQGRTPASIAKELGSTTATVQGWLQGSKQLRGSKKR